MNDYQRGLEEEIVACSEKIKKYSKHPRQLVQQALINGARRRLVRLKMALSTHQSSEQQASKASAAQAPSAQ